MSQRGKGGRGNVPLGDLFALGPKAAGGTKRAANAEGGAAGAQGGAGKKAKGASALSSAASAASGSMPSLGPGTSSSVSSPYAAGPSSSASVVSWEALALEVTDTAEFAHGVLNAEEQQNPERVVGLLCGAVKILRGQRAKPDQLLYLSLMFLAKTHGYLFYSSEPVVESFCSLLKRDVKESYKSKGNALVSVLAANVLMAAFQHELSWPEIFVRVYIDDALGERVWVDHPDCKGFVDNVTTAFGTKASTSVASQSIYGKAGENRDCATPPVGGATAVTAGGGGGNSGSGSGSATPTRVAEDDTLMEGGVPVNLEGKDLLDVTVTPRYAGQQVDHLVMDVVREQLTRRQGTDNITRNFLKFLTSACGLPEVRLTVIPKIEMWVMNPKVSRLAHDLLMAVAVNCATNTPMDVEVVMHFAKLRFKNKPNVTHFLHCTREIAAAHSDNLCALIKHTIFNELSNARSTTNMAVLNVLFSAEPEKAASGLAGVFIELLLQKDDYLRALRALLREIVRALRHEINLQTFCFHLMQEIPKDQVR